MTAKYAKLKKELETVSFSIPGLPAYTMPVDSNITIKIDGSRPGSDTYVIPAGTVMTVFERHSDRSHTTLTGYDIEIIENKLYERLSVEEANDWLEFLE